MTGADFIAVRRISNKADDTLAAPGQVCSKVPDEALAGLEARGAIQRITPRAVPDEAAPVAKYRRKTAHSDRGEE